jgi:hypothetical protein
MATVPGTPDNVVDLIPKAMQPSQMDLYMAAADLKNQEHPAFQLPDQPPPPTPENLGAKRWQQFESRFPKEYYRPPEQQQNWGYPVVHGNKGRV